MTYPLLKPSSEVVRRRKQLLLAQRKRDASFNALQMALMTFDNAATALGIASALLDRAEQKVEDSP